MGEQWSDLANAIVEQAAKDWYSANKFIEIYEGIDKVWVQKRLRAARRIRSECEEFFLSERLEEFTSLNGAKILEFLKQEALEHKGEKDGCFFTF